MNTFVANQMIDKLKKEKRSNQIIMMLFSALLFLCGGCQDFLKESAVTDITSDLIYEDPEGVKTAVVGLYNLQRGYYENINASFSITRGTDLTWTRDAGHDMGAARYGNRMNPRNGTAGYLWRQFYRIIERSNAIIQASDQVDLIEADRIQVLAEAKAFRAKSYYLLLRTFDNIILMTEPTAGITTDFSPAPAEEVWGLIVEDLTFAAEHLNYETDQPGRLTKGFAQHLLADVALWLEDWELAEEMGKAVINEGPYRLLESTEYIFPDDDMNLDHQEGILVIQFQQGAVGGSGTGHHFAQYFTAESYYVDGVERDHDQGGRGWARTHPNDYLLGLYDDNDERLGVYYRLNYYFNDPDNMPEGKSLGDVVTRDYTSNPYRHLMPSSRKYWDTVRDITSAQSYKNIIAHRLAETYFIVAEALMRQDSEAEALGYINPIRERAGIPNLTVLDEDILLEERAKELAFEGHRWYTLKRMGLLVERVRLYGGNEDGGYIEVRENIEDFNVRKPIPQSELDLMPGYPQNEGYN